MKIISTGRDYVYGERNRMGYGERGGDRLKRKLKNMSEDFIDDVCEEMIESHEIKDEELAHHLKEKLKYRVGEFLEVVCEDKEEIFEGFGYGERSGNSGGGNSSNSGGNNSSYGQRSGYGERRGRGRYR